jgi:hypothetical protein
MMNLKGVEGNCCGLILRYHPSIYLEELWKAMKSISQDSWSLSRDLTWDLLNTKQDTKFIIMSVSHFMKSHFERLATLANITAFE